MKYTMGIDPGAHGAIAIYGPAIQVVDMPTFTTKVNGKNKTRVDAQGLADLITSLSDNYDIGSAVIEQVGASQQMGVTSAFAFGQAYGMAIQAVAGCRIPVVFAQPVAWKKHFKLIGQTKDASRKRASELLPNQAHMWARKMDDGRAEAILLAIYGGKL